VRQNPAGEREEAPLSALAAAASTALLKGCGRAIRSVECFALVMLSLTAAPAVAESVELALVLAIDVSASVNDDEYALQRSGTAAAFRDPDVQEAVMTAPGGIAVTAFQWASERYQVVAIPWTRLQSRESVVAFADEIGRMPRKIPGGGTEIHDALAFAYRLFDSSPVTALRRVIDLSGNGEADNVPATIEVRDGIVASGIVINALAIEELKDDLTSFFRNHVIGGPGAFVETAWDFDDFSRAMRIKLLREISPQLGVTTPRDSGDMPKHIRGGATRPSTGSGAGRFRHIPEGRGGFWPGPRREKLVGTSGGRLTTA
jgi:hypothetical protein